MQEYQKPIVVFDDPNLISAAGLAPILQLADKAGLNQALARVSVPSPNAAIKDRCLIAGMITGADSIACLGHATCRW
jgi:hypothetical protein